MYRFDRWFLLSIFLLTALRAGASAILVEDGPNRAENRVSGRNLENFADVFELRDRKRMGVGASYLGWGGLLGVHLEVNYHSEHSARFLVGGGPGYQSVGFGWKWLLMETDFHPVIGFGIADWFGQAHSAGGRPSPPDFLSRYLLTEEDLARGSFNYVFLVPSVGLEWLQTRGAGAGSGLFVEIMFLTEQRTLAQYPSAQWGVNYYF